MEPAKQDTIHRILHSLNYSGAEESEHLVNMFGEFDDPELNILEKLLSEQPNVKDRRKKLFALVESILLMRPINAEKEKIASKLKQELESEKEAFLKSVKNSPDK